MSYFIRLLTSPQNVVAGVKSAPPFIEPSYLAEPPLPAKKLTRPLPPSGVNTESSRPILRRRHSRGSAPPVVSAMRGMSPSAVFFGKRVRFLSGIGLSVHS